MSIFIIKVVLIYYFFSDCHALPRGKSKIDRKENEKYEAMFSVCKPNC